MSNNLPTNLDVSNRAHTKLFRKALEEALATVHPDLRFSIGGIKFGGKHVPAAAPVATPSGVYANSMIARECKILGIAPGQRSIDGKYILVDYKPSRHKYPFVVESIRSARYKMSHEDVMRQWKCANVAK